MVVIRVPDPCLLVLVGASGSGKSYWASQWFRPEQVVSSDGLRAVVGLGEHDQRASKDAFAVLDLIVERRLKRKLTTVIDSTALESDRRQSYIAAARRIGVPVFAIVFDTPGEVCRARNRERDRPVPAKVLNGQLQVAAALRTRIGDEGFDDAPTAGPVTVVRPEFVHAPAFAAKQREAPVSIEFGLQVSKFSWPGGPAETAERLATIARAAEGVGFTSLTVMDHFLQIPGVGREWEDMLESYTTLGYLAGVTTSIRLGAMVTGVTYRNIAHLAKIIATLDVLSAGRAICGIGAAWFEREHKLYGWDFPTIAKRYAMLEDALQLLPLMWGPGSPSFEGRTISVSEAICYPRPLQEHVPLLIGGSGERRTLKLVAQYADACNLFGDAATVRRKIDVLHKHCTAFDRDPAEITITQLSTAGEHSADDQIGRYRELAEAGVQEAIVGLVGMEDASAIEHFAPVVAAFR